VGPGLPQKLLPAEVSGYCFFRFHDKPDIFTVGYFAWPFCRGWVRTVFCMVMTSFTYFAGFNSLIGGPNNEMNIKQLVISKALSFRHRRW
jgi:hypothetical protein